MWSIVVGMLIGCGPKTQKVEVAKPIKIEWASPEGRDHSLVGRWWHPSEQRFLEESDVKELVQSNRVILLGEKHDNIDHHIRQAEVLSWVAEKHVSTKVAFEMLDNQAMINSADQSSAGAFAQDVNWAESGWSDFSLYAPIFETAIQYSSPILAANPPKDQIMTSFMSEPEVLKDAKNLTSEELTELEAEIDTAHCGYSNEEMTKAMVIVQRFKDAWMAGVVEDNLEDAIVLVAGFGHTRIDRGVPWYFSSELAPDVLSIQFREVELEYDDPNKYGGDAHLLYFTPRVDSIDPCVKFKEQLENMGHPSH